MTVGIRPGKSCDNPKEPGIRPGLVLGVILETHSREILTEYFRHKLIRSRVRMNPPTLHRSWLYETFTYLAATEIIARSYNEFDSFNSPRWENRKRAMSEFHEIMFVSERPWAECSCGVTARIRRHIFSMQIRVPLKFHARLCEFPSTLAKTAGK